MTNPTSETENSSDTRSNPFSTRFTRPGQLEFALPRGSSPQSLIEKFASLGWIAQIVGPHGSGKSTLLATLIQHLPPGIQPRLHTLRDGQRRLDGPLDIACPAAEKAAGGTHQPLVIIDGFEQLSRPRRWNLARQCRRRRAGLLVTSHVDVKLPTLFQTSPHEAEALALTERLLGKPLDAPTTAEVIRCFRRQNGNYREMFFDLYDFHANCARGG